MYSVTAVRACLEERVFYESHEKKKNVTPADINKSEEIFKLFGLENKKQNNERRNETKYRKMKR